MVILTWNSAQYIRNCLDSLLANLRSEGLRHELLIVDNGSTDNTPDLLFDYQQQFPDIFRIIRLAKNLGTTRPRNMALEKASGQAILILDADTEIISGSFREALHAINADVQIGIIAPQLVLTDGSIQNSVKKIPKIHHKLLKVFNILLKTNFPDYDFYKDFPFNKTTAVESAISACWILRAETVRRVGLFDERIFYSPEDLDYCIRVRLKSQNILYYPHLKVRHHTQQMSHRAPFSRQAISHFKGLIYFYLKHFFSLRRLTC